MRLSLSIYVGCFVLSLWAAETMLAVENESAIELSFSAANETPYAIDVRDDLEDSGRWRIFTNLPAGPSRSVAIIMQAANQEQFFRLRALSTNTLVIPVGYENAFGNTSGGLFYGPVDFQLFYGSNLFADISLEKIAITTLRYRVDDRDSESLNVTVPIIIIWVSTCPKSSSELSPRRYENWGEDRTLVFSQTNFHVQTNRNISNSNEFQIAISLETAFIYDRTKGNLLFDFFTSGDYTGRIGRTDAVFYSNGNPDVVSIFGRAGEIVLDSYGEVLQISYVPVESLRIGLVEGGKSR